MISKALIYKVQDYQESSKLIYVYTPYGKYSLVGKGVKNFKNPYYHLSDYLNLIEIDLNIDKSIQTLKKATLINDYANIKASYQDLKTISKILYLLDCIIIDESPQKGLFELIINLLDYNDKQMAYLTFLVKITYTLGYRLSFEKGDIVGFNIEKGKTVKKQENLSVDLKVNPTKYLSVLYYTKEEVSLSNQMKNVLFSFIKAYYLYHLDYNLEDM